MIKTGIFTLFFEFLLSILLYKNGHTKTGYIDVTKPQLSLIILFCFLNSESIKQYRYTVLKIHLFVAYYSLLYISQKFPSLAPSGFWYNTK